MDKETFEQKLELYKKKAKEQSERNNRKKQNQKGLVSMQKKRCEINIDKKAEPQNQIKEINSNKKEVLNIETINVQSTEFLAQIEQNIQRNKACTVYTKKYDRKDQKAQSEQNDNCQLKLNHQEVRDKEKTSILNPIIEVVERTIEKTIDLNKDKFTIEESCIKRSNTPEVTKVNNNMISNIEVPFKESKTVIEITKAPLGKKPLTKREMNAEYGKEIENSPMGLYDAITEERMIYWKVIILLTT